MTAEQKWLLNMLPVRCHTFKRDVEHCKYKRWKRGVAVLESVVDHINWQHELLKLSAKNATVVDSIPTPPDVHKFLQSIGKTVCALNVPVVLTLEGIGTIKIVKA